MGLDQSWLWGPFILFYFYLSTFIILHLGNTLILYQLFTKGVWRSEWTVFLILSVVFFFIHGSAFRMSSFWELQKVKIWNNNADYFVLKVTVIHWAQEKLHWAQEKLLPPHLIYLEEFSSEAWPTTRVTTRTDFLPIYVAGKLQNISPSYLPAMTLWCPHGALH